MTNKKEEDWLLDTYDKMVNEGFWGRFICEFKDGKIVLARFERTEIPPWERGNSYRS